MTEIRPVFQTLTPQIGAGIAVFPLSVDGPTALVNPPDSGGVLLVISGHRSHCLVRKQQVNDETSVAVRESEILKTKRSAGDLENPRKLWLMMRLSLDHFETRVPISTRRCVLEKNKTHNAKST